MKIEGFAKLKREIIDKRLCTHCGTCAGVCPSGVIKIDDYYGRCLPELKSKCNFCNTCYRVCPGGGIDLGSELKENGRFRSYNLGGYLGIFKASSNIKSILHCSSAGGIVTTLLVAMLREKLIDAAVVVKMNPQNPTFPVPAIVDREEDIISSSQSKYCILPVNELLFSLKKYPSARFALVGLPCHLHGLRKIVRSNLKIANSFKIIIGLFCGFNMYYKATEYLVSLGKLDKDKIQKLEYRGRDYPGGFLCITREREFYLPKHHYAFTNLMFVPPRCLSCIDLTAELSDISVGDYWQSNSSQRFSSVIVRTWRGLNLYNSFKNKGYFSSCPINEEDIYQSHKHLLHYKKIGAFVRMKLSGIKPSYNVKPPPLGKLSFIKELLFYLQVRLLSTSLAKVILSKFPLKIIGWLSNFFRYFSHKISSKSGYEK